MKNFGKLWLLGFVVSVTFCLVMAMTGCSVEQQIKPIDVFCQNNVRPIMEKVLADPEMKSAMLQGAGSAINPALSVTLEGYIVQGFKGKVTVQAEGVSLISMLASQQSSAKSYERPSMLKPEEKEIVIKGK